MPFFQLKHDKAVLYDIPTADAKNKSGYPQGLEFSFFP